MSKKIEKGNGYALKKVENGSGKGQLIVKLEEILYTYWRKLKMNIEKGGYGEGAVEN